MGYSVEKLSILEYDQMGPPGGTPISGYREILEGGSKMDKVIKQKLFIGVGFKVKKNVHSKILPKMGPQGVPQFQGIGKY